VAGRPTAARARVAHDIERCLRVRQRHRDEVVVVVRQVAGLERCALEQSKDLEASGVEVVAQVQRGARPGWVPPTADDNGMRRIDRVVPRGVCDAQPLVAVDHLAYAWLDTPNIAAAWLADTCQIRSNRRSGSDRSQRSTGCAMSGALAGVVNRSPTRRSMSSRDGLAAIT